MGKSSSGDSGLFGLGHVSIDFSSEVLDKLGFGVVIVDSETHKIVYVNPKIVSISGYRQEDLIGCLCHHLLCPYELDQCPISNLGQLIDNSERTMNLANGKTLSIIKTVVPADFKGKKYYIESIIDNSERKTAKEMLIEANSNLQQEIAERRKVQKEVEFLAYHDSLSGLPNRILFANQLNHALNLSSRTTKALAVLFLDLDNFKMINDTLGHTSGDVLLAEVAKRLVCGLRATDIVARIGGDEFLVLIENLEEADAIEIVANKILSCFTQPFLIDKKEVFITTSIGVAVSPTDGTDSETLIKNADMAMYKAKENGRNQWAVCTAIMKDQINDTLKISNALYRALERGELQMLYQPEIDTYQNKVVCLEALLRWNHPKWGTIYPERFIPIAEQTGLIHTIGEWVIKTVCGQNKSWQDAGLPIVPIAVNLSPRQLQNPNIVGQISDILLNADLDSKYLEIELTESIAKFDTNYLVNIFEGLRNVGVTIAIDDFGTEYSSLNYLRQLPIDKIKIASPFIQGIDVSEKDASITTAIIVLARSMGLRVVAEGVETESQVSFLKKRLCYEMQGYFYRRPMPAADMANLLSNQGSSKLVKPEDQTDV